MAAMTTNHSIFLIWGKFNGQVSIIYSNNLKTTFFFYLFWKEIFPSTENSQTLDILLTILKMKPLPSKKDRDFSVTFEQKTNHTVLISFVSHEKWSSISCTVKIKAFMGVKEAPKPWGKFLNLFMPQFSHL